MVAATPAAAAAQPLPQAQSLITVGSSTAWVTALKKEWTGNGVVLRLFDVAGVASSVPVQLTFPASGLAHCSIIELDCSNMTSSNGPTWPLPVGAYAIETFRFDVGL